jgi:preprotein translocase subunit SecE
LQIGGLAESKNEKIGDATLAEKSKHKKPNVFQVFFRETTGELRKVSWPTWTEARQLTGIVIVVMIFVGIILGITDGAARGLLKLFIG